MHKRLWLLAGAAAAILLLATSATAGTTSASQATAADGTPAAAPFAQAWAKVPTTTAGRKAANIVVFGAEQDIDGFNVSLICCNEAWAGYMGNVEALRGAFNLNAKGQYVMDLVSSASVSKTGVSYTIKPNAYWYWGGKKIPVTYKDFVYTLQQVDNASDQNLVSRTGLANLDPTHYTHKGLKQVTFFWKTKNCSTDFPCGPYANWQSLFTAATTQPYPGFALQGVDFGNMWTNCICGANGQPVSDGPYYVSNYTKGQGTTLKANPFWYGTTPKIGEVDFKLITDTNTEEEAMRGGEVDAVFPTFGLYLAPLKTTPGITYNQIPGYYLERLNFREGNAKAGPSVTKGATNPLLRAPWMRQAISMAIDRQSIINTIYGDLAAGTKPAENILYFSTEAGYTADYKGDDYNPQKALAILAKHCTGGPTSVSQSNSAVWQCSGLPASFNWTWTSGNAPRTTSEAIAKAELKSIGIQINETPLAANVVFGPDGIPSGGFDIAEYANITSGDPGDWADLYRCQGPSNYTGYCSHKVDTLLTAASGELDPAKRAAEYQQADQLMAAGDPSFPLYQRPVPLVHKSDLLGMVNNPSLIGVFWNIEDWHWKS